jgi:hypothetical protein
MNELALLCKRCCNDTGEVVGIYDPAGYIEHIRSNPRSFDVWNKDYPRWMHKPLVAIRLDKPQYSLSKEQIAYFYDIPAEHVSDKMQSLVCTLEQQLTMPMDAAFTKEEQKRIFDNSLASDE